MGRQKRIKRDNSLNRARKKEVKEEEVGGGDGDERREEERGLGAGGKG